MIDKRIYQLLRTGKFTQFLLLYGIGKRPYKRVNKISTKFNGFQYQYTKFTKIIRAYSTNKSLGIDISTNSGLSKGSNTYDNRVSIVVNNFNEGKQLNFQKVNYAVLNGLQMLSEVAYRDFDSIKNIYPIIYDPKVLKISYLKIKSNFNLLEKSLNQNLFSLEINDNFFLNLSNQLKSEAYIPLSFKKIIVTKNKSQVLEIPSIEDKIVQQSLLLLLEAVFKDVKNYNIHTVCKNIRSWKNINWFINSSNLDFFNKVDHHTLIKLIQQKIKDQQVLDLLWKYLRLEEIFNGQKQKVLIGISKKLIISTILINIYFHELDIYINKLEKEFNTKKACNFYFNKPSRNISLIKANKLQYKVKIYYSRYENSWLIGIKGLPDDYDNIYIRIVNFLSEILQFKLSPELFKLISANRSNIFFLNYNIYLVKIKGFNKICIDAPYTKIKKWLIKKKFFIEKKRKWVFNAITAWVNYSHSNIIDQYNFIIKNYLTYYSHVNNFHIFNRILKLILRQSCALTLGLKYKLSSRRAVFKKFGKNLTDPKTKNSLFIPEYLIKDVSNYNGGYVYIKYI